MDCGPPGSSVHGISQLRMLEWVAISFSRGSSRPRHQIVHWQADSLAQNALCLVIKLQSLKMTQGPLLIQCLIFLFSHFSPTLSKLVWSLQLRTMVSREWCSGYFFEITQVVFSALFIPTLCSWQMLVFSQPRKCLLHKMMVPQIQHTHTSELP